MPKATKVDFAGKCFSDIPSTFVSGIVSAATTIPVHSKAVICIGFFHFPRVNPEEGSPFFEVIIVEIKIPQYPV